MEIAEHLEYLRAEGDRFADVVSSGALDARVPGCPEWDVEALVRHLGFVHRWAATIVRERLQSRPQRIEEGPPGWAELVDWYRWGHGDLLRALSDTRPEESFWAWGPAPSPVAFWARRQAHETAIHRLDAEQAAGKPTPFPSMHAADGVDEWLNLAPLRNRVPDGDGRRLQLLALDAPGAWNVELRADGIDVRSQTSDADCTVRGAASDLFALVLNRTSADRLDVTGDSDVLHAWRDAVRF